MQTALTIPLRKLLEIRNGFILHQAICAVAALGIPDLLERGVDKAEQLAQTLNVNEQALYRTMRALAGYGVFEEVTPSEFRNSELSSLLRRDISGSIRPAFLYFGTEFYFRPFGELLSTIRSGEPASKLFRTDEWLYMQGQPEVAGIFDDAMTNMSTMQAPLIAGAYDFGQWETIADVGGGNGILLAEILRHYTDLRGLLADQAHVIDRARQRGYLGGDLAERIEMRSCDFFAEVPTGCHAYIMKNVIHDWNDEDAHKVLSNCRRAIPPNGALLLIEWLLSEANTPSSGKMSDLIMLVLTGGRERTVEEYRHLLAKSGFRLNRVVPTEAELGIFEAVPV